MSFLIHSSEINLLLKSLIFLIKLNIPHEKPFINLCYACASDCRLKQCDYSMCINTNKICCIIYNIQVIECEVMSQH